MAVEWSNEKVIAFLEILQTEPCLWDPKLKSYKNRVTQSDAWRRIIPLLPFKTTIEEMKKKKESLMGYYRTHLNRYKKSLKSGAGKDDVYTTNWFAFETMDNFLRGVYEGSRTLNTETHDDNVAQERSEERNYGNENSPHLSTETEEASQNIQEENGTRPRENKSSQNYNKKRQLRDELPQEIKAARRQMDEAFEFMKEKKDDECEMFGRMLASKLKKIRNANTRDILMNDIQNSVFRACMADRLEQQSAVPRFATSQSPHHQAFSPSPNPPTYQSPPGHSKSQSPHHQAFSPSPNPPTYQSPPGHSTSQSPHHQAFSPSPNYPTYQSPPGHSTCQSSHHQALSPSPNPPTYQSPPGHSTSQSPHHQAFSPSPNYPTYQSPPGHTTSQSPHHQALSPSPNPPTYQSPPGHSTSQSPHHQALIPSPNRLTYQSPSPDQFSVPTPQENFIELPPPTRASQIVITESGEIKIINDQKFM